MENKELHDTLALHLDTLKCNLEVVSLDVLKTKYQKPFNALRCEIQSTVTAYIRQIAFRDLRIRKDLFHEAVPLIEGAIQDSGLLNQISAAAFRRQDLEEIEQLALVLKKVIQDALKPFYEQYLCLYLTEDCFLEPPRQPDLYCEANGCILHDGIWVPLDSPSPAILLYIREIREKAA